MNIKIDYEFHNTLQKYVLERIEFGDSKGDDTDLLCVVSPNMQMDGALVNNNHFFFYKDEENKVDYIYATPRCLVDGLITGSSTLLFELLMRDVTPKFFHKYFQYCGMHDLINQKLGKAIIGCAQRDFKQMKKLSSHKDKEKKLKWAVVYTNWLIDYYETTCKELNIEGMGLEDVMSEIRSNLHQLRKTVDIDIFIALNSALFKLGDYPELLEARNYYFEAWRESL